MRGFRNKFCSRAIRRHAAAARYWVSRDGRSVAGTPAADGGRQVVNAVLLNNIDHRDLRVDARRGARFGDRVMSSVTFPAEFRSVQAHYPIVFRATGDGDRKSTRLNSSH